MSAHEVTNQTPPLCGYNVVSADPALREGIERWGREQDRAQLEALGALAGGVQAQTWGDQADRNPPVLHTYSPQGDRIDEVDFHPAWHRLLETAVSYGLTAEPWTKPPRTGAHLRRAAGFVAWSQVEAGHGCPVSMTVSAMRAAAGSSDPSAADAGARTFASSSQPRCRPPSWPASHRHTSRKPLWPAAWAGLTVTPSAPCRATWSTLRQAR